jgi:hypothetical protein
VSYLPPEGQLPELSTTRVASGASARLVALAVAGVLTGVVGIAVINRPPPPAAPGPTAVPAAVVAAAATPAPNPTHNELRGDDGIFGWPVVAQVPLMRPPGSRLPTRSPTYSYVVSMAITGGLLRVALEPRVAQDYSGRATIVSRDVGARLRVELGRTWVQSGLTIFESFDTWEIPLRTLRRSHGGQVTLLIEHVPPNSNRSTASAVDAGYTFTVIGRHDGTNLNLLLDLVWPASIEAARYFGNDTPGTFNRCRWDYGPLAAPPRVNNDEAACLGI